MRISILIITTFVIHVLISVPLTFAQRMQPKTFTSADQAAQALYEAVSINDTPSLHAILGTSQEFILSDDAVRDKAEREQFTCKYLEMHRLVREDNGSVVLYVGAKNWPFPVPLVENQGKWYFDSDAGAAEILARHIGENEISVIRVCQEVAAAGCEKKASNSHAIGDYAQRLISEGNRQNTLPEKNLFAGYYFRVVPVKAGGIMLVAYPSEFRISGVMTFILSGNGSVYEKNLGPRTSSLAQQIMKEPKSGWGRVQIP